MRYEMIRVYYYACAKCKWVPTLAGIAGFDRKIKTVRCHMNMNRAKINQPR